MKKQGEEVAISVHNYLAPTYTPNNSVGHVDKYNIDLVQYCNNALNEAIHVRRSQFLFVSRQTVFFSRTSQPPAEDSLAKLRKALLLITVPTSYLVFKIINTFLAWS